MKTEDWIVVAILVWLLMRKPVEDVSVHLDYGDDVINVDLGY